MINANKVLGNILGNPIKKDGKSRNKLTVKNATVETLKRAHSGKVPGISPSDAQQELAQRGLDYKGIKFRHYEQDDSLTDTSYVDW